MDANALGIGQVTRVDDGREAQQLQVTERAQGTGFADRPTDNVTRVTEFGFASHPPLNSEVLVVRRGGDRSQPIAIATNHRPSRPRGLEAGDAGIYDVRGAKVMLTADGLVIDCAGLPAVVRNATTVRVEADRLEVTGDVVSRADGSQVSLNALRDAYAEHKHTGVDTGDGTSGQTDTPA